MVPPPTGSGVAWLIVAGLVVLAAVLILVH